MDFCSWNAICHQCVILCHNIIWRGGFEEELSDLQCTIAVGQVSGD